MIHIRMDIILIIIFIFFIIIANEASEILLRYPYTISKMGDGATVTLFDVLFLEKCKR